MITAAARAANRQRESIGKTHRECPICTSLHLEYEFLIEKSPVCRCQTCGLLFLNPASPGAAASEDPKSLSASKKYLDLHAANADERIQELASYAGIHSGRMLVVGGDEFLIAAAQKRGFEVVALSSAEFEATTDSVLPEPVDLCLLFCSLEKVIDPLGALQFIRRVLSCEGALMVVAPTTDSRAAKLFRSSWWEFSRWNRFYFSSDSLQSLLSKAGFGAPMITADRALVSMNYLRENLAKNPRRTSRYRLMGGVTRAAPVLRNKPFRLWHGRSRFLVKPIERHQIPVLSVIVPVYNEKATFVELMDSLLQKSIEGVDIEIILVESNSSDGTRDEVQRYAREPRVTVILQDKPQGKGNAVRAGLEIAKGDIVLFQDADLEYDLNDYEALIAPILRFETNFVLGSRHSQEKGSWKIRQFADSAGLAATFNFGHLIFLTLFNLVTGQRLTDPFTMYKVFRRDCIWGLSFECNRFDFDFEIVMKLLRKGYKPLELPVNYVSRSLKEGKKVTMIRDPLTWVRALIKYRKSPLYKHSGT